MNTISIRILGCALCLASLCVGQTPDGSGGAPPPSAARRPSRTAGVGTIQGTLRDDTGGVIPGALITVTDPSGQAKTVTTAADGSYTLKGLAPGIYTVSAAFKGLQQTGTVLATVTSGATASGDVIMTVQEQRQEVTVTETTTNQVNTDPANNASALTLKAEDLQALPDDPDDLQADLQALAGPSAGPGGNQIYIDGFTGGRLPPKESIREIRINSNPFSAEFDKLGFGRIQVFTKPGSDKFHGQGYYNVSDGIWNSRNPFLSTSPDFRSQLFGGNVSGPIGKTASFFVDAERRNIDDNGIINATILPYVLNGDLSAPNALGITPYQNFQPTPQRRTTVSPRVDYQLGANNTLSGRFTYLQNNRDLTGVGGFSLQQNGYRLNNSEYTAQIVETAVLGPRAVNETHFQYDHENQSQRSVSTAPQINVGNSFVTGGSGYSAAGISSSSDIGNDYELQNYTSLTHGTHVTKFGIRIRAGTIDDTSPKNYNGTYSFLGGNGLTSIQQYQLAVLGQALPSQYTFSTGNPFVSLSQIDYGPFVQDDWKLKPNLTLSLGLRWEAQTNIADKNDWAPRVAFAWSPDSKGGSPGKTVVRGGWGIFYDRFQSTNVLTAYRYNGLNTQSFTIVNPDFFQPATTFIPTALPASDSSNTYKIDSHLHAPYVMQTAIGVERQILRHTTVTLNFTSTRGNHELRTVNINAPDPFLNGIRPLGASAGNVFLYESTGIFKQNQLLVNVNSSAGKWLTLFGRYALGSAHSNTDGLGTLPANQYDFSSEYGRSAMDVRHSLFVGGSITSFWAIRFSPFIVARTGAPFNISTGTDYFNVGVNTPTARPSLVTDPTATLSQGGRVVQTPYGLLSSIPTAGPMIERNAGDGPGYFGFNLRVSKTWGFGPTKFQGMSGGGSARGGGGPGGGGRGGGPRGGFDTMTEHRYNLVLAINARNLLNHENLNTPNGAITSPYFLQSTGITGGFGAEATASNQRRIDLQLRFSF